MPLENLPPKKQKYVKERSSGKTKYDAAIAAGYSDSMARAAIATIETPDVRAEFAKLMRKKIPAKKIAKRIAEGLDAMETKFFQHEGEVKDTRKVVAWSERRQYASLAAEYGGYFIPHVEMTGLVVHVLTPTERREAAESVKRLVSYDDSIEGEIVQNA